MSLTDSAVRNLKPKLTPKPADYWRADTDDNGDNKHSLYLRVRATGKKVWVLRRMRDGKLTNVTLGRYPDLSLAKARKQARDILEGTSEPKSLKAVAAEWFETSIDGTYRRPHHVRQYLDRLPPKLSSTLIHQIGTRDLHKELLHYSKTRGPVGAARFMAILKQLFRYAVSAGYITESPITDMTARNVGHVERARERVLSDDEIRAIWSSDSGHTSLLRFLLLTGQRIGEAQRMTWDHIKNDRWHIPAEHSKNKKAHWCALSRQSAALLDSLPRDRRLVFGSVSNTAVQSWVSRWNEARNVTDAWTPHDLRRTMATRMNEKPLCIGPHIVEKILNHSMQGVMAVYNRATYEEERVEAMQKWADELDCILARGTS